MTQNNTIQPASQALWHAVHTTRTGKVVLDQKALMLPLHWRKPRRIFVDSMSDLFHEGQTDANINRVFAVMALCPRHTFQLLTKRADRMQGYMSGDGLVGGRDGRSWRIKQAVGEMAPGLHDLMLWPLPNVWLGFSAEDQATFDARWAMFRGTPAAVTMVSLEPLLGHIILPHDFLALGPHAWVIAGGESGPRARPPHPDWFRKLRDDCAAAGVPFLFKQWGEWAEVPWKQRSLYPGEVTPVLSQSVTTGDACVLLDGRVSVLESVGASFGRRFEGHGAAMRRIGKRAAGRMLDGKPHDGVPR